VPPASDRDDYDHRLVRALDHPVRVRFLELLGRHESLSPREALPLLQIPATTLSRVNYHVRVLDYFELVTPGEEADPDRGVPFQATEKGEAALAALGIEKFD
jgi:hypothetical protein